MAKILKFQITKKHIYRLGQREVNRMYKATAGGRDPVVDVDSIEMFEMGLIDEPRQQGFEDYCIKMLAILWEGS